jgi:hypothetical protein
MGQVARDRLRQSAEGRVNKRKAKTNTKAEPGFIKRRNRLNGQFRAHLIEMVESPAWQVLLLSERRVIDRIEIELAHHGGNDNGKLPVTYEDFIKYGVSLRLVAPAIRATEALGFIRVTEHGRGGNADHRQPNLFFLTFANSRDSRANPPTHDWRKIKTIEEAELIAAEARSHRNPYAVARGKRQTKNRKPLPLIPQFRCHLVAVKRVSPHCHLVAGHGHWKKWQYFLESWVGGAKEIWQLLASLNLLNR